MLQCIHFWTLEEISDLFSIATPIILLIWFCISQYQFFSKKYYSKIEGVYAGWPNPDEGVILKINNLGNNGFFTGEFEYSKTELVSSLNPSTQKIHDGIYTFYVKLDFHLSFIKTRNPLEPKVNLKYKGRLYIINRLDIDLNEQIKNHTIAEYKITHFRELQILELNIIETSKKGDVKLPKSINLYKKMGYTFEPYINIKEQIFNGKSRVES